MAILPPDISQAKINSKAIFTLRAKTMQLCHVQISVLVFHTDGRATVFKLLPREGALERQKRYTRRGAEGDLVNYQAAASASSPED